MPRITPKEEISLLDIKKMLREEIKNKYGMNVREFTNSEEAAKLGIGKSLSCYLSPTGSSSFTVFQTLAKALGLGNLEKEIKVTKIVKYYL